MLCFLMWFAQCILFVQCIEGDVTSDTDKHHASITTR